MMRGSEPRASRMGRAKSSRKKPVAKADWYAISIEIRSNGATLSLQKGTSSELLAELTEPGFGGTKFGFNVPSGQQLFMSGFLGRPLLIYSPLKSAPAGFSASKQLARFDALRPLLAITDRPQFFRLHSRPHQKIHSQACPLVAQPQIVLRRPAIVAMTLDHNRTVRKVIQNGLEHRRVPPQNIARIDPDFTPAIVEECILQVRGKALIERAARSCRGFGGGGGGAVTLIVASAVILPPAPLAVSV